MKLKKLLLCTLAASVIITSCAEGTVPLHTDSSKNPPSLPEFLPTPKGGWRSHPENPKAQAGGTSYSHPMIKGNVIPGAKVISWELEELAQSIIQSRKPDFAETIRVSFPGGVNVNVRSVVCTYGRAIASGTVDEDGDCDVLMMITANPSHEFGARINAGSYSSKIRVGANMRLSKSYLTDGLPASSVQDMPGHLRITLEDSVIDFLHDDETITQISFCRIYPDYIMERVDLRGTMNYVNRKADDLGLVNLY